MLLSMLFFSYHNVVSQTLPEDKIKAVFIFNFTHFVEWPEETFENANDPLIIGIIGGDPFGEYINETVSGEMISGHPIVVRRYQDIRQIDCHILYINVKDAEEIKKIIYFTEGKNILTVSDEDNFVKWGGIVQFMEENNKIKLQINVKSAQHTKLAISSKLLSVAEIYK
ncbi:MAG: YfiR family protein [Bacteroidota bacterium]